MTTSDDSLMDLYHRCIFSIEARHWKPQSWGWSHGWNRVTQSLTSQDTNF